MKHFFDPGDEQEEDEVLQDAESKEEAPSVETSSDEIPGSGSLVD